MNSYVILPSNSSMDYFPDNTLSNFKVKLSKALRLTGKYEVALVEIIYPYLHLNVEPGEASITMLSTDKSHDKKAVDKAEAHFSSLNPLNGIIIGTESLDPGVYNSHHDILLSLKPKLKRYGVTIKYKRQRHRFAVTGVGTMHKTHIVTMTPKLARILGFGDGTADSYSLFNAAEAAYMPDLSGGEHTLFVYSNIVEHQIIGDSLAPLLRVVCPEQKGFGSALTSEKYIKPYYVDVSRSFIDVIDIQIRTTTGKLYPFISGSPVILKLHFRPKQA